MTGDRYEWLDEPTGFRFAFRPSAHRKIVTGGKIINSFREWGCALARYAAQLVSLIETEKRSNRALINRQTSRPLIGEEVDLVAQLELLSDAAEDRLHSEEWCETLRSLCDAYYCGKLDELAPFIVEARNSLDIPRAARSPDPEPAN